MFDKGAPAAVDSRGLISVTAEDVSSNEGIVAVSQSEAAEVGRHILASGGNAVDAAIAVQFALNVVEPGMSGIGGGTYVTYFDANSGKTHSFDARETASRSLNVAAYRDSLGPKSPFEASTHGYAVGVPGAVRLLSDLSERFGSMNVGDLIEPSLSLCLRGVRVNASSERYLRRGFDRVRKSGEGLADFCPGGRLLQVGDVLTQRNLAKTFSTLQSEGLDSFYEGQIAESIVSAVADRGGSLTMNDLSSYTVVEREPLKSEAFGYEFASMGPSSSGGITLMQILKIMERFDFEQSNPYSAGYLHALIETMHLTYADRVFHIGDPDFCSVPVEGLLDAAYLESRLRLVRDDRTTPTVDPGSPEGASAADVKAFPADRDERNTETTHFSITDKSGNIISFTTSIGQVFGSGVMAKGAGFMLNSTGGGFSLKEDGPNTVEPGKRPLSSIAPTLVFDQGKPVLALGSPGATTIIGTVVQVLLNTFGFKRPIQEAILTPRIYSSSFPRVEWEDGIPLATRQQLISRGHAVEPQPQTNIGDVHAVLRDWPRGTSYGASDDNRDGTVLSVEGRGRSVARERPVSAPATASVKLIWDGTTFPLAANAVLQSERNVYVDADVLGTLVDGLDENGDLEVISVGQVSVMSLFDVCDHYGFDVKWDSRASVLTVDTGYEPPAKNAVQLVYSNERMSITR